jgi:hypothetical protein
VPAYLTSGNWIFRPTARGRADPPPTDPNLTFTKFQTPGTVVKKAVLPMWLKSHATVPLIVPCTMIVDNPVTDQFVSYKKLCGVRIFYISKPKFCTNR